MRASWARRAILLGLAGGILASCGPRARPASFAGEVYPLTAFRFEAPDRVAATAAPEARWISFEGRATPALVSKSSFDLAVRVPGTGAARFLTGIELVRGEVARAELHERDPVSATFRVRSSSSAQEPGRTLFEKTLTIELENHSNLERVDIDLGNSAGAAAFVRLELSLANGVEGVQAIWLDPRIERANPVSGASGSPRRNVLLVTSDTTRFDALSATGGRAKTPRIDALARNGVLFENAFTVALGTTPSHATLLTGSQAAAHRVYSNEDVLGAEQQTLAEVLRAQGFATAAFVGSRPLARALRLDQGFEFYDDLFLPGQPQDLDGFEVHERRGDVTVSRFLEWFEGARDQPFFAWVHFYDPHQPYFPPRFARAAARSTLRPGVDAYFAQPNGAPRYLDAHELRNEPAERFDEITEQARSLYAGELEFVDQQVGRMLDALAAARLDDRTLVVFVADHGENFEERELPKRFAHDSLLSPVTHIPLVVKVPGEERAASRAKQIVGNLDIAPSILEWLGIEAPETWTGRSFLDRHGALRERTRSALVLEAANQHEIGLLEDSWLYRRITPEFVGQPGAVQYLGYPSGESAQLFDLALDPLSLRPIVATEAARMESLRSALDRFLAIKGRVRSESLEDAEHLKALQALGYLSRPR